MSATIKAELAYRKKNNGKLSIRISYTIKEHTLYFTTGLEIDESQWDIKQEKIKGNSPEVKDQNLIISSCKSRLNDILVRYRLLHTVLTPDLLRKEWKRPSLMIDVHKFIEEEMKQQAKVKEASTIKSHGSMATHLKEFKPHLSFTEFDEQCLEDFRYYLKSKKHLAQSSTQKYLKNLNLYLNIAVRRKVIPISPMKEFKIGRSKGTIEYCTENELRSLFHFYRKQLLPANLHKVLRAYLFSCVTGLRLSDIQRVQWKNIVGSKLVYVPHKTRNIKTDVIYLPLKAVAWEIINESNDGIKKEGKLIETFADQVMQRYIKKIFDNCGIGRTLNYHTSRHTFATYFYKHTKDLIALQKLLGHSDVRETMIYAHVDDEEIEREMDVFDKLI
jgi:integrase